LEKGILAGYPVTDLRVALFGGRMHEVDSAAADFEIAGSMAVRRAVRQAAPALLEPIMRIDVNVDEEQVGTVIADLGRRRGQVRAILPRGPQREVVGEVPLATAYGYATDLRSLTQGRGTFTLEFDHYELVPEALAEEIVQQRIKDGKIAER
jgi:elongation factor G